MTRGAVALVTALLLGLLCFTASAATGLVVLADTGNEEELVAIEALGFTPVGSMDELFAEYDPLVCAVGIAHSGLGLVDLAWLEDYLSTGATVVAIGWDIGDMFGESGLEEITPEPGLLGVAYTVGDMPINYTVESEDELNDILTFACIYTDAWLEPDAFPFDLGQLDFDAVLEEVMAQVGPFLAIMDQFLQPEWEYHVASSVALLVEGRDLEESLNELGSEGWELVTVTGDGNMIFKRRALNAERLLQLFFEFAQEMIALGEDASL